MAIIAITTRSSTTVKAEERGECLEPFPGMGTLLHTTSGSFNERLEPRLRAGHGAMLSDRASTMQHHLGTTERLCAANLDQSRNPKIPHSLLRIRVIRGLLLPSRVLTTDYADDTDEPKLRGAGGNIQFDRNQIVIVLLLFFLVSALPDSFSRIRTACMARDASFHVIDESLPLLDLLGVVPFQEFPVFIGQPCLRR